jgi:hypothetical protein
MFQQVFQRATPPDRAALLASLQGVLPDVTSIRLSDQPFVLLAGTLAVSKTGPWLPADLVTAQALITAAANASAESDAQADVDTWPIEYKALVLAIIDALNVVRAGLPVPLGAITPAQAIAAIRSKAALL